MPCADWGVWEVTTPRPAALAHRAHFLPWQEQPGNVVSVAPHLLSIRAAAKISRPMGFEELQQRQLGLGW